MRDSYDVVVLGAGPAGENVADYAIRGSTRTALLIERELVGGECSYYACMPSKALLRPLEVRATAEALEGLPDQIELDAEQLLQRRDAWVANYQDAGQVAWARGAGIEVARGQGRMVGPKQVEVITEAGSQRIGAESVVVATGSQPVIPPLLVGLAAWTSRDATGLIEVPGSVAVVGGGVVALEASRWLAALGAKVTLLVRGQRLLSRLEPFAGELVAEGLVQDGVEIVFGASLTAASRDQLADTGLGRVHGGPVRLEVNGVNRTFAELLVATGRTPALSGIGLESIGLDEHSFLDPSQRPEWLHAVGDAGGEAQLTHWGKYRARMVGQQIAARAEGTTPPPAPPQVPVPQVVFTDPQVAAVGLTVAVAQESGIEVWCPSVPMGSAAGYSLLRNDAPGRAQLVVDAATGKLLGATFVGAEVAELVHAATVAIVGGLTLEQLRHAVPSYPTASEVWLRLLEQ